MAGGGVGVPTTTAASPTTPAAPLDGSTQFEAVKPVDVGSPDAAAPAVGTAPAAPVPPGTRFNGLPPWLSSWSGSSAGNTGIVGPSASSGTGGINYKPYVPGTSLTGYAAARAPAVYMPPSKPTTSTTTPSASTGIPPVFDQIYGYYTDANGKPVFEATPEQKNMMAWFDQYTKQQQYANRSLN